MLYAEVLHILYTKFKYRLMSYFTFILKYAFIPGFLLQVSGTKIVG